LRPNSKYANFHQPRTALSAPAAAVIVVAFLVVAVLAFEYYPASTIGKSTSSTVTTNQAGSPCSASNAWSVSQIEKPYGGDTLAGTVSLAGFQLSNGQIYLKGTETSSILTYPIWAQFQATDTVPTNGLTLASMGGSSVATLQCVPSSSNSNSYVWTVIETPIQAPSSGTSATTDVKALCIASNGNSLTTASVAFPTSSTEITCNLNILQAYRGAGYTVNVYGTQQNPVTSYSKGAVTYSGSVSRSMVALILSNQTGISVQLDPTAPSGMSLQPYTGNTLTSGTKAWVVSGFSGCTPASGSAASGSPYTCLSVPIDAYETISTTSHHIGFEVMFVDMQSVQYILANLATAAVTSFTTSSSAAGACNGYSAGITPTAGTDAGSPAALVEQCFGAINGY